MEGIEGWTQLMPMLESLPRVEVEVVSDPT